MKKPGKAILANLSAVFESLNEGGVAQNRQPLSVASNLPYFPAGPEIMKPLSEIDQSIHEIIDDMMICP